MLQTILISILVLGILIFVHEYGHYLAARKTGVHVLELAVGFGKRIFSWQKGGTIYALRAFPLGGFCRLYGEGADEREGAGSFQNKAFLSRFVVIGAGSFMNIVLGVILFSLTFFFFTGVPDLDSTNIGEIKQGSPAYRAGIENGDKVVAINGTGVNNWREVLANINASFHAGEKNIKMTILRESEPQIRALSLLPGDTKAGLLPEHEKYVLGSSLFYGVMMTKEMIVAIFAALGGLIVGTGTASVAGPVGIIAEIGDAARRGMEHLFLLTAIISINLGIINLLPIPALDGSRLLFLIIEKLRGRPVSPRREGMVHYTGLLLLLALIAIITFRDIGRLIGG